MIASVSGSLTLSVATSVVDAALSAARDRDMRPLAIVVLDTGGHPVVLKRQDDAGILRHDIAYAKAWGCLGMGQGGGVLARHAERSPTFFASLGAISNGRIASSRGGVLIRDSSGALQGAVGVSGDRPENDEAVAVAGIEAAGFVADVG